MTPVIGITQPSYLFYPQTLRDNLSHGAYHSAIRHAGGVPRDLTFLVEHETSSFDLTQLDGILFSGGGDINPNLYKKESTELIGNVDDRRDAIERALFYRVLEKNIPFLGICRGFQMVNVAMGGSLFRDLKQECPSCIEHDWYPSRRYPAHLVSLESECRLSDIGYPPSFFVNSLHHQGIEYLGRDLKPIAHARDGLIEAVELTSHRFGLAVQWHPEWLIDQQSARSLFESFVKTCG